MTQNVNMGYYYITIYLIINQNKMEHLNDSNFENFIKSHKNVVVDFFASWCRPCKMLAPVIEELADEYKDKEIKIVKVDVDEARQIAQKFDIMSIPTMVFIQNEKIKDTVVGLLTKDAIKNKIQELIK